MKRYFFILVSVVGLLVFFIPFLISIPPFNQIWISRLEERLGGKIKVDSAKFRWLGPQTIYGIHYESPALQGSAKEISSSVPFWDIQNFAKQFHLEEGFLKTPDGLALQQVQVQVSPSHTELNGISSEGGAFQIQQTGSLFNGSVQKIPTVIFDRLLKVEGLLSAALGSSFDLQGSWNAENHAFEFHLSAPTASAKASGTFRDGAISLSSPLSSSLFITPPLTNRLNLPSARGQISLTIQPDAFRCPVPFKLQEVNIDQGQLQAKTLEISTNSVLEKAGSLLKSSSLLNQPTLVVRSTPIDFKLNQGQLQIERLDFLINKSIHFCLWGKIDLLTQNLQMDLGIPAQTLASLLGIPGLNANAVLKIPIRGTLSNPELETGAAAAKITALSATQLVPQKGILKLLPKVMDAALDNQGDIPPQRYPLN